LKIIPIIISFTINLILVIISLYFYSKTYRSDLTQTARKIAIAITIKSILLFLLLLLFNYLTDIKNAEFGISFGIFLFLGVLSEIIYIHKKFMQKK